MALTVTLYVLSGLLGLAIGSFLNVVIYRLPKGQFFSKARSFCPKCGAQIKAYDNIPVISYIILKGKCRTCKEHISLRYPVIELLNCILWIVNFAVFKISYMTIIYDILVSVLIVIAMVDFDTFEIPDSSNLTILLLGLITFIPISGVSWQSKLIGCVCISIPMLILALFGGMGLGDVKLYFVLGLLFGWQKILLIFLISVIVGGLFSVVYMVIRKKKEQNEIAEEGNTQAQTEIQQTDTAEENVDAKAEDGKEVVVQSDMSDDKQNDAETAEEQKDISDKEEDNDEDDIIDKGKMIPFGPFIVIATFITVYFGDMIINGYTKLLFP